MNSARTTPQLRELCENCAITTPITASAKSLTHAVQNKTHQTASKRFKSPKQSKQHTLSLSRNLTFMQQITIISARTGKCTAYKRCPHQGQPRTKFGGPIQQHNTTWHISKKSPVPLLAISVLPTPRPFFYRPRFFGRLRLLLIKKLPVFNYF